jgi:transposase
MQLTYRFRVKDKHAVRLFAQAAAVNFVWNYCNEVQKKAVESGRKWLNWNDLDKLTRGATKAGLDLHSQTVQQICKQYDTSRKQHCKPWLNWRKTHGARRSLGWVPFNQQAIEVCDGGFAFRGVTYDVFMHRPLPEGAKIGCGSFSEDSRGRWYINIPVEVSEAAQATNDRVGIDLGTKTLATLSCGAKIAMPAFYRASEEKLATSQRARKSKRVKAIHAKIRNRRKDFLHKATTRLVQQFGFIAVGDVSPSKLARTNMAKSVLDAGWSDFRTMLSWKSRLRGGGMCLEVCEHLTTQACSECGCLPPSRPRGIAGLRIREWTCDDCGAVHDRDQNAALNILRLGLQALVEGANARRRGLRSRRLQAAESSLLFRRSASIPTFEGAAQ